MKTIAVIGPEADAARRVAGALTSVRAIAGAGPSDGIDGVIAVVDEPTADNVQVANAVAETMGTLIVASDASWPDIPGVHYCSPTDVAGLEGLARDLWVDVRAWESDARRADLKRAEQSKVAIRLHMQTVMNDLLRDMAQNKARPRFFLWFERLPQESDHEQVIRLHRQFLAELKVAILSQGIVCPHIADDEPTVTRPVDAPGKTAQLAALFAGTLGIAGLFFAVGRVAGFPWAGLAAGIVVAVIVGGLRYSSIRWGVDETQRVAEAQVLEQTWGQLVTDVLARVEMPRITDQIVESQGDN